MDGTESRREPGPATDQCGGRSGTQDSSKDRSRGEGGPETGEEAETLGLNGTTEVQKESGRSGVTRDTTVRTRNRRWGDGLEDRGPRELL